jgi:hypothetical protein
MIAALRAGGKRVETLLQGQAQGQLGQTMFGRADSN